ncbi:ABC transporter permease [Hydrogenophaga crassostreae]|uniref:ABC transporter permease n=1 Tax=Hydrogenophaga crassostreae TaxID=1763535 RepID=UPI0009EE9C35|nr:ABC transporter permease [Hydrogenophaga crassostreae]
MKIANDIALSIQRWPVWFRLGFSDTASKYRRSVLGPLWLTLGLAITVAGLGTFWSLIWKVDLSTFFPYLTAGLIVWNLLVGALIEGSHCFSQQASVIRVSPMPLFLYPLRLSMKLLIAFLHNILVFVLVAIVFDVSIKFTTFLVIPALIVLFTFSTSTSLLLGILGARYRDFPPIVESVVPLMFFLTPVLWFKEALGKRGIVAELNPLTHLIAIVREPMLGKIPTFTNYAVAVGVTLAILGLGLIAFSKTRNKISLWV